MSEWDKLWDVYINSDGNMILKHNWFKQVKAEGDNMQTELDDVYNRLAYLLDSMHVDWDDIFMEYDENEGY